ncbi:tRNA (N6-isopentenyl adenosine(37)-C2)-methylthiotransferase MiaB [Candidatus Parcubacteria bacterium]|nr:MAG: tRNA (N6-isopentenyl adenosine(37)-C2)-methylthiotransferase MiaB [Candidatus Parcubacteria bacterium]
MKYHLVSFGCQFNSSDAEKAAKLLDDCRYRQTDDLNEADLVLVLACSVRQSAIDRIYGLNKKFIQIRRRRPLITALTGCVLKSDMPKMKKIFDIVFDITDLSKLVKLLNAKRPKQKGQSYFDLHPQYRSKFQSYVPIMTGCNNFCTYCVVPYTRGREACRKAADVVNECKDLIAKGYNEITLIGQNVNSYQGKINNVQGTIGFAKLLLNIDKIPGNYRLRFMTSHPKDLSDELIDVLKKTIHVMPYLHLPVQSGNNTILKKMNRNYTASRYKKLINKIRKAVPGICVSTDVIVGFPGETKKQFNDTVKLFKEVKFDMAYIAEYSIRQGTVAAKMDDDVPKNEKERRKFVLNGVLEKTALSNNKKYLGKIVDVLVEKYGRGFCSGKTATFKTVKFKSQNDFTGEFVKVKIKEAMPWGMAGELANSN